MPHIYLSFQTESERDSAYQLLEESPHVHLERVHVEEMTLQWQNGIVSNYDYLMYLNWYVFSIILISLLFTLFLLYLIPETLLDLDTIKIHASKSILIL